MRSVLTSSAGYENAHTFFSLYFVCLFFYIKQHSMIQIWLGWCPRAFQSLCLCVWLYAGSWLEGVKLTRALSKSCYPRSRSIWSIYVCAVLHPEHALNTKRNSKFKHPCSNSPSYSFLINRHVFNYCLALCASPSFGAADMPVVTHLCCLTSLIVSYKLSIKPLWNLSRHALLSQNIFLCTIHWKLTFLIRHVSKVL